MLVNEQENIRQKACVIETCLDYLEHSSNLAPLTNPDNTVRRTVLFAELEALISSFRYPLSHLVG